MKRTRTGTYIKTTTLGEEVKAFVPDPLPPVPELEFGLPMQELLGEANRGLGSLDTMAMILPDTSLFLYMYVRKEAVLSSQIEGTQSSLSDLLMYENEQRPGVPLDDVQEVSQYVAALEHGLHRMRTDGFPLSLRLLKEMHEKLLSSGRGSTKMPGEFRTSQNWLGGGRPSRATFVPPPPGEAMLECLRALEGFLHDQPVRTPPLIKAALAHVQFETIHPFLDGNGRLGRLLITLTLCHEQAMREPLLYLSLYFKRHRTRYYRLLQNVRETGDWEVWLTFFLQGVIETSRVAVNVIRSGLALFAQHRGELSIWNNSGSALAIHEFMQRRPILSIKQAAQAANVSEPTASTVLRKMEEAAIVREITGGQRNRLYAYNSFISLLDEGIE